MNKHSHTMMKHLFNIFLFTGLGLFSHLLLSSWIGLASRVGDIISSVWSYVYVVVAFNLLGFTLLRSSEWVNRASMTFMPGRSRLFWVYCAVAVLLFVLNYGIIVLAKLMAGAQLPFQFPNGGWRILVVVWLIELVVVSLLLANRSMAHSFRLQQMAQQLQEENDKARYVALRNQLNPHFLFNNLNTLVAEIEYNPANAMRFTRELSEVYRYVLQSQHQRLVPLDEELRFLTSYIFLHQVRLGNCISVDNRLAGRTDELCVAPLSLQLLAENVIKHCMINADYPMVITLERSADGSMLEVSNPLRPKLSQQGSGVGLKNLDNRYHLLCGRTIEVESERDRFVVKIPLLYE